MTYLYTLKYVDMTVTLETVNRLEKKVRRRIGHANSEGEKRCSSTLFLTSGLDGGGWLTLRPGRFTLGKETRYPLYRRLGGFQGRSERVREMSPPPGFDRQPCSL